MYKPRSNNHNSIYIITQLLLIICKVFCILQRKNKKKEKGNGGTEAGRKIPKEDEGKVEDKGKRRRRPGRESWRRQRGLVRRVGPRAFPRFREAYRTTALRFASLIPSTLVGPALDAYTTLYTASSVCHTLTEPGRTRTNICTQRGIRIQKRGPR